MEKKMPTANPSIEGNPKLQEYFDAEKNEIRNYDAKSDFNLKPLKLKELCGNEELKFIDCVFSKSIRLWSYPNDLTFINCKFQYINAKNSKLEGKIRFRECEFHDVNFKNTKFEDLADFWRCTFHKPTIFFKTDFLKTTVFSAATFEHNVLFTYTLIDKLIIFRGTNFESGLDLSTAILSGKLSLFDLRLKNFESLHIRKNISPKLSYKEKTELYERQYDNAISKESQIPIENKVETFRIIKKLLKDEGSASAMDFNVLEKEAFRELLRADSKKRIEDRTLLSLNKWSNRYGQSYLYGAGFTLLTGWVFFYLSILGTSHFDFSINPLTWNFFEGLNYFTQYLLPTHRFDYIKGNKNSIFYAFDFLGRIAVGYGIYQTIQAFRKYK